MSDRRGVFFVGAAVVCFLLAPFANGYAVAALAVGGLYLALAAASWLDAASRRRAGEHRVKHRP